MDRRVGETFAQFEQQGFGKTAGGSLDDPVALGRDHIGEVLKAGDRRAVGQANGQVDGDS